MEWYQITACVGIGFVLGAFWGVWVGLKAFAAQRVHIDSSLQNMSQNVDELSRMMHDGMIAPSAVQSWIASIRTDFTPARRWKG